MIARKIFTPKGFTLIELLVVISIVAFLAAILSVGLNNSRTKSLDTRRVNDIFSVQKGLNLYFTDARSFPPGSSLILGTPGTSACLAETGFVASCPVGQTIYMAIVPSNPGPGGADYVYTRSANGTDYTLTFSLETNVGSLPAGANTLSSSGIN